MFPDEIKQFAGAFCRAPAGPETGPQGDQKLALPQKAIGVGGERSSRGQGSDNQRIKTEAIVLTRVNSCRVDQIDLHNRLRCFPGDYKRDK